MEKVDHSECQLSPNKNKFLDSFPNVEFSLVQKSFPPDPCMDDDDADKDSRQKALRRTGQAQM